MAEDAAEDLRYVDEDVRELSEVALTSVLGKVPYNYEKVGTWSADVIERTLKSLAELGRPFKYVVTCVIQQNSGAGLQSAASCYWDPSTDGSSTVKKAFETMTAIVT